jgi:hypothetical protein
VPPFSFWRDGERSGLSCHDTARRRHFTHVERGGDGAQTPRAEGSRLIYSSKCMRDVMETVTLERIESRLEQLEGMSPNGLTTANRPAVRTH